jgi:hypothetical protein
MKNLITLTLTVVAIASLQLNASESGAYSNANDEMQRTTVTYERPGIVRETVEGTGRAAKGAGNVAGNTVRGAGNVVDKTLTGTGNFIGGIFGGGKRNEDAQRDAEDRKNRKEENHKKKSKELRKLGGIDKD